MRSFNGDYPPWRRQPLGNKPWKKELHHQECALDKKLGDDASMKENKGREIERERGEHEIEGVKEAKKLNFELCLTRLSFIKVTTSVTHTSIYSLGSFLEKLL